MKDVTQHPHGATMGIMGWPYPGHSWTMWRHYVLVERLAPNLALDGHVRATNEAWEALYAEVKEAMLAQLRVDFPHHARWADSIDWLQERGRGDVVAVMSLHTGHILSHHCLGWREDYRDSAGTLWNWEWVVALPTVTRRGEMETWRADASGCILDKRGEPTSKVLVKPSLCGEEMDGIMARWQSTMGESLLSVPPVRTVPVEHEEVDWEQYEASMAATLKFITGGGWVVDLDDKKEQP